MRIRFIGSGGATDSAICEVFGLTFEKGEWLTEGVDIASIPPKLLKNPTFQVEPDPLDHDEDGKPGGSRPEADDPDADEKAKIRADLAELGVTQPHPRTGLPKLRAALEAALQA